MSNVKLRDKDDLQTSSKESGTLLKSLTQNSFSQSPSVYSDETFMFIKCTIFDGTNMDHLDY